MNLTELAQLPAGQDEAALAAELLKYRSAARRVFLFLAIFSALALAIGWFASGLAGFWGALIGVGLALLFCGSSVWSGLHTIGAAPVSMAATVLLGWAGKLVVLIAVLAVLRGRTFYNPFVLFGVIAAGLIGSLILQVFAHRRNKAPYVIPNTPSV